MTLSRDSSAGRSWRTLTPSFSAIRGSARGTGSPSRRSGSSGGRGSWRLPAFFDRSSASAFADMGTAGCAAAPLYPEICSPRGLIGSTIASIGAELGASVALFQVDAPQLVRVGVAANVDEEGCVVDGRALDVLEPELVGEA